MKSEPRTGWVDKKWIAGTLCGGLFGSLIGPIGVFIGSVIGGLIGIHRSTNAATGRGDSDGE